MQARYRTSKDYWAFSANFRAQQLARPGDCGRFIYSYHNT